MFNFSKHTLSSTTRPMGPTSSLTQPQACACAAHKSGKWWV